MDKTKVHIVVPITRYSQLDELTEAVDIIEVRADLIENTQDIGKRTAAALSYVLRSKSNGGYFIGTRQERTIKLLNASLIYDFVELEAEHDLIPELLAVIPAEKRRIAWYGPAQEFQSLWLDQFMQTQAACYKIIVKANIPGEEISILRQLQQDKTGLLVAFAEGKDAGWTQVLAPFIGSKEMHAKANNDSTNNLHFTVDKLKTDYNLPFIYPIQQLYGIIGNPVYGSISPNTHNAAYRQLGLPYLYLPFQTATFTSFFEEVINNKKMPLPIKGLTVVAPFKELGFAVSHNQLHPKNAAVKHCNGMHTNGDDWTGFSTDAIGAIEALNSIGGNWKKKDIAIIGCGGAGIGIAAGLKDLNLNPTLVNRTVHKGKIIAKLLGLSFTPLSEFSAEKHDIIIHCTPVGKKNGEVPFDISRIKDNSIVIDHVYTVGRDSALIRHCNLLNLQAFDGKEIANLQIRHQFKHLTGIEKPETIGVKIKNELNE